MTIKDYVKIKKEELRNSFSLLKKKAVLVIVQVNDDPASNSYIKGKLKDANEVGIEARLLKLSPTTTQEELLKLISQLNEDKDVTGFIVQMPLPKNIDERVIKRSIIPDKDVDGFSPFSRFTPATPKGILSFIKDQQIPLQGKNAVVIGRSNIVGRPVSALLLKENANVTVLHSYTKKEDMKYYLSNADIIVSAVGKKHLIDKDFSLKKTAILIDVGISRDEEGLHGDFLPNLDVEFQTPVPGGVGLLTRLSLLLNLLEAAKNEF